HAPPLVQRHLRDDVRGRAEAVQAEALRIAREPQGPIADQPGAQERRRGQVVEAVRDRKAVALVGAGPLRVAAVDVVTGEPRAVAKVLSARHAVTALAARPAEPRHAQPPAVLRL